MDVQNNLDLPNVLDILFFSIFRILFLLHFSLLGNAEKQYLVVGIGYDEHVLLVW